MARRLHSGFSRPLRQGQRRKVTWFASVDQTVEQNLAAATSVLSQSITGSANDAPFTIARTRGMLICKSDQVVAARFPFGALGFSVVSDQALAIGITALPLPIADEVSDLFFVYQTWYAGIDVLSSVGFVGSDMWARFDFDSKAQRKVEPGQAIVVVMENAATTGGVDFILKFRMLIKLH